jgi:16S rRNA (adenine1518-N6/adenine1519-N6)-dimethyltransferase
MFFLQKPKKSLGQNFLIDKNVINKIIEIANNLENKTVLEIGPGYGNLTREIVNKKPKKILAIEKDKKLSFFLQKIFKKTKDIKIINNDILKIIEEENFDKNTILFGNLPYNISTQILASLIMLKKWPPWYDILILMFQKEVADRIIAKPNSKEFGRLTVLCNWRLDIKKHFDISKNCFSPKPKIDSTVLSFTPKKNNHFKLKNPKNLEKITRILFSSRRKMINKNFAKIFGKYKSVSESLNLNLSKRPGELDNEMFYKIAMRYEKLFN